MIFKSRYDRPIKTCFYDGSEESAYRHGNERADELANKGRLL